MAKIKLQGISQRFDGVAAKDLKIGDILIWNYGSKSEVVGVQPSKTRFKIKLGGQKDGSRRTLQFSSFPV